jgi:hypothetical protein
MSTYPSISFVNHHTLPAPPERPAVSCRLQAAETTKRTARGAGATCRTPRPFLCFVSISGFRVAASWAPSRRARDAARRPLARKSPRAPFPFPARPVSNRTARTQIPVHACLSSRLHLPVSLRRHLLQGTKVYVSYHKCV